MAIYYTNILKSIIVVVLFMVCRIMINRLIHKTILKRVIQKPRGKLIKKAINFILTLVALITLIMIWGVRHAELAVFLGSILTIIGVAFFAQWSLLSNITSSIIIFFGHSVRIGDKIRIMEAKDYDIQGKVLNIGLFFTKIKLEDTNDEITLPNNIFILKTIRKVSSVK